MSEGYEPRPVGNLQIIAGDLTVNITTTMQSQQITFPEFTTYPVATVSFQLGGVNDYISKWHAEITSLNKTSIQIAYWTTDASTTTNNWILHYSIIGFVK